MGISVEGMDDTVFEEYRGLLEGVAYRMCGVLADAQDVVQETYLRWQSEDREDIRDARAWLVTVCSRLAMDHLKSARHRRETYVGTWLPEPFLDERTADPSRQASLDESVSMALMLALEKLTPAERAAFLLHDVFGYGFEDIAQMLEKSEPSCRKLASRARAAVRDGKPRFESSPEEHRRLLDSFFEAAHSGEIESLKSLLAESVELHSDGGGKVKTAPGVLQGPDAVAKFFVAIWREKDREPSRIRTAARWYNGRPGVLILWDGQLVAALSLAIEEGRISRIFALRNPEKLEAFERTLNTGPGR
jgi:RNA polymerase sigma-70 factor (ECF subfamily)